MTRADLIAKLEAAEVPDEKLDGQIFRLLHQTRPDDDWWLVDDVWHLRDENDFVAWEPPPPFTSSLDAGRTLLLPGWEYLIFSPEKRVEIWVKLGDSDTYDVIAISTAKTVENAFVAAALRARGEG